MAFYTHFFETQYSLHMTFNQIDTDYEQRVR